MMPPKIGKPESQVMTKEVPGMYLREKAMKREDELEVHIMAK